ncbi:MAG: bifunctional rhamnulose-1-phosphate aldolase/short-chain dehydrogenase [Dehalococcoidia bacterium]|nr:bifunctional rhamnulose-1-phosphate aldolase/short-chain dehydrogenase [Dehalococcoidia bacterium]MSQ16494.1 bifunctional rhamnulose-1-phosphate aldolase/short-chain dehydrogenase [Dehalococcoidia bacterium]
MRNHWSDSHARHMDDLDKLVYMSRLIGQDTSLVVWGGGNTSIKVVEKDFMARPVKAMRIKGSGSDMKSIERRHFPRLRLDDVLPLFDRDEMPDEEMVAYLENCLMDPNSLRPSIETLLHAFLPFKCVAHSHADAVVALTNNTGNQGSPALLDTVYGQDVAVVEYLLPGFRLSKLVGQVIRRAPSIKGVVLMNHGLFTWGDTPEQAYQEHIDLVTRAEQHIEECAKGRADENQGGNRGGVFGGWARTPLEPGERRRIAAAVAPALRGLVSQRQRMLLRFDDSPEVLDFIGSAEGRRLSGIGPATPDHLIQTKQKPLWIDTGIDANDLADMPALLEAVKQGITEYAEQYAHWYQEQRHRSGPQPPPMLDPYPRVVLLPGVGMWTTGRNTQAAQITGDIYHHTISVIGSAQAAGGYTSLTGGDAYDAEYWPLELYKLTLAPPEKELARKVALVTGAANGIGRAIALRLAQEGAHVVVTDVDVEGAKAVAAEIDKSQGRGRAAAFPMNVADEGQVAQAFQDLRLAYGGLDILVSNAGIATPGAVDELSLADWRRSLDINTTGHFLVAAQAVRLMKEQGTGGSLVFIGTKNVPAPGARFGAYSVSKAAEVQLARILALENGQFGIRSNVLNPDAIFQGSHLWSEEVRQERAAAHRVPVDKLEEFYQQRNLLHTQVRAEDVAEAVLFLASERSSRTTGAMIPVDGGVGEAFPR